MWVTGSVWQQGGSLQGCSRLLSSQCTATLTTASTPPILFDCDRTH
jgi:hypothetical protein